MATTPKRKPPAAPTSSASEPKGAKPKRVKSKGFSRRKGASYERDVAEVFRAVYEHAQRGIGQARAGGEVPDVKGTPWWIEAKCRARPRSVHEAMEQARKALKAYRERNKEPNAYVMGPLVVSKRTNGEELATVPLEVFLQMLVVWNRCCGVF
jgi:hypothetical protein